MNLFIFGIHVGYYLYWLSLLCFVLWYQRSQKKESIPAPDVTQCHWFMVSFIRLKGLKEERDSKDTEFCLRRKFQCSTDGVNFSGSLKLAQLERELCLLLGQGACSWPQRRATLEVKGYRRIQGEGDAFCELISCHKTNLYWVQLSVSLVAVPNLFLCRSELCILTLSLNFQTNKPK